MAQARYRKKNPDRNRGDKKAYYQKNKVVIAEKKRAERLTNPEKVKGYERKWRAANRDKVKATTRRRKKRLSLPLGFSQEQWVSMCRHFGDICLCCRKNTDLTIDHVVPIALGGLHHVVNLQPLCRSCNSAKQVAIMDYRDPSLLASFLKTLVAQNEEQ